LATGRILADSERALLIVDFQNDCAPAGSLEVEVR